MSKNQFFFVRKEQISPSEGEIEIKFKEYRDSFNVNKIIRSLSLMDGRVLVLLDDFNERFQDVSMKNSKGVITAYKREKGMFQTEIYLTEKEDVERFYKLTDIQQ